MKKRILIAALAACVLLSFAGCASSQTSPTTDNSFGAVDLSPEEPANPARYIREFVHAGFEEFSESSYGQFFVSDSEVESNDDYGYSTIRFSMRFDDTGNSYRVSCISDQKSYDIMLFDSPEASEIKNLLAATIYAAGSGLTPEQAVQEAEAIAATMPSTDSRPCRTEARVYGNCKIFVDYDNHYESFTIYSHHSNDEYIADGGYTDLKELDLSRYADGLPDQEGFYKFSGEVLSVGYSDASPFTDDLVTVSSGGKTYDILFDYTWEPVDFIPGETRTFYVNNSEYGITLQGLE